MTSIATTDPVPNSAMAEPHHGCGMPLRGGGLSRRPWTDEKKGRQLRKEPDHGLGDKPPPVAVHESMMPLFGGFQCRFYAGCDVGFTRNASWGTPAAEAILSRSPGIRAMHVSQLHVRGELTRSMRHAKAVE